MLSRLCEHNNNVKIVNSIHPIPLFLLMNKKRKRIYEFFSSMRWDLISYEFSCKFRFITFHPLALTYSLFCQLFHIQRTKKLKRKNKLLSKCFVRIFRGFVFDVFFLQQFFPSFQVKASYSDMLIIANNMRIYFSFFKTYLFISRMAFLCSYISTEYFDCFIHNYSC